MGSLRERHSLGGRSSFLCSWTYCSVDLAARVALAHSPKINKFMNTPESLGLFVCGCRRRVERKWRGWDQEGE